MSDKKGKPRKIRRRRTTGRVSGTSQSAFASQSMSKVLQQQAEDQAKKPKKEKASDASDENASD